MAFLEEALTQTQQHLVLIQDGARYHTSKAMQAFFVAHADRLTCHQLPAYSPECPIEHLWRNVKKDATHLKYFPDFADLVQKVDNTLQQLATFASSDPGTHGPLLRIARGGGLAVPPPCRSDGTAAEGRPQLRMRRGRGGGRRQRHHRRPAALRRGRRCADPGGHRPEDLSLSTPAR